MQTQLKFSSTPPLVFSNYNINKKDNFMPVKPIPEKYHSVTPYILVPDVSKLIEFIEKAFGGIVIEKITAPEGLIMHAEIKVGNSIIMMGHASGKSKITKSIFYIYTEDTDTVYMRAIASGASSLMEPADQYYGDRNAAVYDMFGNQWWIAAHFEDVSNEELIKRAAQVRK